MGHKSSPVLIDHISTNRSGLRDTAWVLGFSILTGWLAQLEIRLPYTPVPLTMQTFGVLLGGAVLGSRRGFLSQLLYLTQGAAGFPVFAGGAFGLAHLLGPSGGYLWTFPVAAGVLGWLVERGATQGSLRLAASLFMCDALILLGGSAWLGLLYQMPFHHTLRLGLYPFLVGDVLKIGLVGIGLPRTLKFLAAREE